MSPSTRHTLSAVLGKAKVGGLVLAAMFLVAGTAEAATGLSLSDEAGDPVAVVGDGTDPATDPTDDPTEEPTEEPTDDPSDDPTEEPTEEPTDDPSDDPTEEPTDDPTEEPTDDPTVEPTDDPTEGDEACATATNHGQYVSSIAKSTPSGPGKGAIVAAAAHSDCGKKTAKGSDDTDGAGDADDSATKDHAKPSKDDKGHGPASTPPGQAKKNPTEGGQTTPGKSANAPGHSSSHGKGHNK